MKRVFALERFVTGVFGLALLLGYLACCSAQPPMRRARWRHPRLSRSKKRVSSSTPRWPTRDQKMTMTVVILDEEGNSFLPIAWKALRSLGAC